MSKRMLAEKLKELTDEVNELHPLLDSIFQKMPSIQNVAYTHGVNEMGPILSSRNYLKSWATQNMLE